MEVQVNIGFDQLVKIVKMLPKKRLDQLLNEIKGEKTTTKTKVSLEELLLDGPVATKEQLEIIADNRKAINEWRKS